MRSLQGATRPPCLSGPRRAERGGLTSSMIGMLEAQQPNKNLPEGPKKAAIEATVQKQGNTPPTKDEAAYHTSNTCAGQARLAAATACPCAAKRVCRGLSARRADNSTQPCPAGTQPAMSSAASSGRRVLALRDISDMCVTAVAPAAAASCAYCCPVLCRRRRRPLPPASAALAPAPVPHFPQ